MYSNNDYRYYLEHRLMESNDFLAHYGVKGMKWKDHKYAIGDLFNNNQFTGVKSRIPGIKRASSPLIKNGKKKVKAVRKDVKKKVAAVEKKAKTVRKDASKKAASIEKKAKATAKKAYKYADDHVDRYSYSNRNERSSYNSTGVRIKAKNSTTDIGVYNSTQSRTDKNGKTRTTGGDFGIEVSRNNKKKRKASYGSAGIGTRYGAPVYVYRHNSKKY